jgi:hypothetical protein
VRLSRQVEQAGLMEFNAVANTGVDDQWRAVDAADTSFLSVYGGAAELLRLGVIVDERWPGDDVTALVSIS